ncbi:MAG: hypothetical protein WCV91_04580 [Candidatus Margulisiibacteriota bacterium]
MRNIFRFLAILIIFIFSAGILPSNVINSSADAKAKKKIVRKVPRKKAKKTKKVKYKKAKKIKKSKKTKKTAKPAAKPAAKATGKVASIKYYLEEGVDDAEAEKIVSVLRDMGVEDASIDVDNNALSVKFDSGSISSAALVNKLKSLGYTATKTN